MREINIVRSKNKMFLMIPITENQIDELANKIEAVKFFREKRIDQKKMKKDNLNAYCTRCKKWKDHTPVEEKKLKCVKCGKVKIILK